jgi:hypothetical protein
VLADFGHTVFNNFDLLGLWFVARQQSTVSGGDGNPFGRLRANSGSHKLPNQAKWDKDNLPEPFCLPAASLFQGAQMGA